MCRVHFSNKKRTVGVGWATGMRGRERERRMAKGTGREKEGSRRQKEADGEEFHYIFQHVKIKIF